MKSLADEYVKEGMQRFVIGKYSRHVHHAGMLGYVLDGDVFRAMANVLDNIRRQMCLWGWTHLAIGLSRPIGWATRTRRKQCITGPIRLLFSAPASVRIRLASSIR